MYAMAKIFHKGEYRLERLTSFLNPWADPTDAGWQVIQGLYAIGSRTDFLELVLEIAHKNICGYQSHKMTSYSQLLLRNLDLLDVL